MEEAVTHVGINPHSTKPCKPCYLSTYAMVTGGLMTIFLMLCRMHRRRRREERGPPSMLIRTLNRWVCRAVYCYSIGIQLGLAQNQAFSIVLQCPLTSSVLWMINLIYCIIPNPNLDFHPNPKSGPNPGKQGEVQWCTSDTQTDSLVPNRNGRKLDHGALSHTILSGGNGGGGGGEWIWCESSQYKNLHVTIVWYRTWDRRWDLEIIHLYDTSWCQVKGACDKRFLHHVASKRVHVHSFNPFSTGTGWTLCKVYGGFRISYGTGSSEYGKMHGSILLEL